LIASSIRWLLISVCMSLCYLGFLVAAGLQPAHGNPKLATTGETAAPAALKNQLAGEQLFQTYSAWLQTAHASAIVQGQETPLPSQF